MKLLTIIGARPQIIKAAAMSRAIQQYNNAVMGNADEVMGKPIVEHILHTGQHYDDNMSAIFIRQLGIPEPTYNLHIGSGSHGVQTAEMIRGIENVLQQEHYDGVILYGDTNSTLAGAVAASKLHVPIYHIEAGLRSYNMAMPEEVNRMVCDQLSNILFCPTLTAVDNLKKEGFDATHYQCEGKPMRKIALVGDVMLDNSLYFAEMAEKECHILEQYGLKDKGFILATIHRNDNTDTPSRLTAIFEAMLEIAKEHTIVLPLHPRTRKMLPVSLSEELYEKVQACHNIMMIPPASFFEIILLEKHAQLVLTDSGGVQKEAFFYHTPCVIMRPETEWVEIVAAGAGILADASKERILAATEQLLQYHGDYPNLFGDGKAAMAIVKMIARK